MEHHEHIEPMTKKEAEEYLATLGVPPRIDWDEYLDLRPHTLVLGEHFQRRDGESDDQACERVRQLARNAATIRKVKVKTVRVARDAVVVLVVAARRAYIQKIAERRDMSQDEDNHYGRNLVPYKPAK